MAKLAPAYLPRRPQETVLHRVVRAHLETFIAHARETYDAPLPKYVREELRAYLRCGIFDHGFTRARCEACGHDLLIAFSCKTRGICPSCAGRRMSNTAAHIVDRIIPSVPVRQWVLSLPFDVRARAAFDARVLTALIRAFAKALGDRHRRWARAIGLGDSEFAAVTFVQRFGSSLNLNVHLHVVVVDGVFSREDGDLSFTAASPPTRAEMLEVIRSVRRTVDKLSLVPPVLQQPLGACANIAVSRGEVRAMTVELEPSEEPMEPGAHDGDAVEEAGYNREHLLRYCARPSFSLARLIELPNNEIGYRIKKLRNHRSKLRIMTPLELLARLAALVPPPRHPLVRFHGAFAPRSSWRRDVVPKSRDSEMKQPHQHSGKPPPPQSPQPAAPSRAKASATLIAKTESLTPNILAIHHWERLNSGALVARSTRVDWALLMRRTFDVDVLECPKCTGELRILAIIDDEAAARQLLDDLHIPRTTPPQRARDPTTLEHSGDLDVC